ncbi:plasmid partition protein ParG [Burkholderia gladioli]|uniref:plasmid partition protein ParG n=1 Tax=Burkholderia gladioli TaxID=28095 RepID=UPI001641569B|nr:plasmid partition protein ParG [Burkholderia gladioli]
MAATKKTTKSAAPAKKAVPAKKAPVSKAPAPKKAAPRTVARKAAAPAAKKSAAKVPVKSVASSSQISLSEGWYQRGFTPEPFKTPVLPPAASREPETRCHGFVLANVKERFEQRVKAAYTTQAIVLTQHIHGWLRGKVTLNKVAESPRRMGEEDVARISVDIPTVLQRKFKAACAEQGYTVTQVLGALVADWTTHYKNYV